MANKQHDKIELVYIDINKIEEPPWNPNEQTPDVFNELVKNIKENGFKEPMLVAPRKDKEGCYFAISGSHRLKAGRVADMIEVPCIIEANWDEDMQKFQNMRFNIIKGKLDPLKFTKLFNELSTRYGEDTTKAMMAFVDKAAFDEVYKIVKDAIPDELKKQLEKSKAEIKTVDALAAVLNEMFAKYGNTMDKGYMVFTFGGVSHLWIIMDDEMKKMADGLKKVSLETGKNINDVFRQTVFNKTQSKEI